jgi:tetratricopeptide (TPR) repeat protein
MGGVYLFTPEPPDPGGLVEILFDTPNGGEVRARATVRHGRAGKGMGLQFLHMGAEDRARLHRFIQQLKADQPKQSVPAPRSWFTPEAIPLDSGELESHHALFALLHRIYYNRMTGKLQLVRGSIERQLFFNFGQLVFATSSDRADSLGDLMLRSGALNHREFEEASALLKTGQRFGSAIAEMGIYTVEEISTWIQRQLTEITASVLDYPSCRFYFFNAVEKNIVPEVGMNVPIGKLLLEAVRRAKDLPFDHLAEDASLWVDLSSDPLLRYQAVRLDDNERQLLAGIGKAAPAKQVLANCSLDRANAARALYALLVLGIVVAVTPTAAQQAEAEQAVPAAVTQAPTAEAQTATAEAQPPTAAVHAPTVASIPEPQARREPAMPAPSAGQPETVKQFEEEMRNFIAPKSTYYELLGLHSDAAAGLIKERYQSLVRKFHPDHHMGQSEWVGLLQEAMGRLTEAYGTLINDEKRAQYDKELAQRAGVTSGQQKAEPEQTVDECFIQAKQCLFAHDFPGSITWLRKCVELAPDVAKYHAILARSLAALPQYRNDAIFHYERAIELDPTNTSTYFQFAELYELMKVTWRAVTLYQKVLAIDPDHSKASERLAHLEALDKQEKRSNKPLRLVSRLFQRKS